MSAPPHMREIVTMSTLSILAILAVVLRFWARRIKRIMLELNDYVIVLGLVFTLGSAALYSYDGFAYDANVVQGREENRRSLAWAFKVQFTGPLVWVTSVTTIRGSIILLYIRIFPIRSFRLASYSILAINLAFCLSAILASCLICRPVSYRWDRSIQGGMCGSLKSLDLFTGMFNLFLDVCVVVMPMPILWGLKMNMSKKIGLTGIFGMGIGVCGFTIYRIYVTEMESGDNTNTRYPTIGIFATIEALLGIINACLPLLKPVFGKMRRHSPGEDKSDDGKCNEKENNNTTSGSIPILLRVSHLWSKSLGKYTSSDEAPWPPKILVGISPKSTAARSLRDPKVDRIIGMKVPEIYVRKSVDVESDLCDDHAPIKEESAGGHIRW